ncbi:type II toxin-antitoxin system VapC family toxin [Nocardiopsis sp. YSL2]|uniref:type II toxin-antitoxin system VapC family toxin n=1 Tax=Nocardiopsis sp. YSL2 TaxID=2939492 RepID=UPI0026F4137A|nr:type II toxin-antitoxin system VapC family toxin [Nocardiopsis sp. YSL2]
MADTLIDSCVLIDVIKEDAAWAGWSAIALAEAADTGRVVINQLVFAEVSLCLADPGQLDAALDDLVDREDLPWKAAELAVAAHAEYRGRGGAKTSPMPDFYIGAHAAVCGYRLLTRNRKDFASYFPGLDIIAP